MTDEIWYYADRQREKNGPVSAEAIAALLRRGDLDRQTLVWRDGMSEWQPLSRCLADLGLTAGDMARGSDNPSNPLPPTSPPKREQARSTEPAYAGFWRRFAALIIDRLLIFLILMVVGAVVMMIALAIPQVKAQSASASPAAAIFEGILWLGYFLIAPFYFALQEASIHQATLGKRALGIKVTTLDGGRLSLGLAFGRWFAAAISYLTFYIGFIMAGFTERKQALHDLMVGTLVVDRWAYTDRTEKQQRGTSGCLLAVVIGFFAIIFFGGMLAAIAVSQYQDYVVRAHVQEGVYIADGIKVEIANTYTSLGRCPTNADEGFKPPEDYAGSYVASATVGAHDGDGCAIEIRYGGSKADRQIAGKTLVFEATDAGGSFQWSCRSDTLKQKFLPSICRSETGPP